MVSTTRWSQIARAAAPQADAGLALAELCSTWRPVILGWLRRREGDEADDLTQAIPLFFLEHALAARADPSRGRFRQFMFSSLQHWWLDRCRQRKAAKRGEGLKCDSLRCRAPISFPRAGATPMGGAEPARTPCSQSVPKPALARPLLPARLPAYTTRGIRAPPVKS
jgi:DNA-directed RNA polymerase specialized sigma24 family protein